ncbi:Hypothetical protein CINCED_3A020279 [Cinara cedri]|uniref:Uncharacterized protein n=1 Tax=Cinara cedri TaxID=506608 RepID=A0A5E4M9N0_9HEMI|nr:Hypothetical protein CINCED_3A020279 [Cinara cedri]
MDPKLTEHLIRRRLILENYSESSEREEKNLNNNSNFEISSAPVKGIIPSIDIKNNFLEKLKKFESFSDNQNTKVTHQNIVEKHQNEIAIINKFNQIKEPILKKPIITNNLQFDNSNDSINDRKQKQDNFHEKIKQFELSFVPQNKIQKFNKTNEKKHQQTKNTLAKQLKTKFSSKSDYNNWELDKTWVFHKDDTNLNNTKNQLKSKPQREKKKKTEIVHNTTKIFSSN